MKQKVWLTWNNNQNSSWDYPIIWNQNLYIWNKVKVFIETEISTKILSEEVSSLDHIVYQSDLIRNHLDFKKVPSIKVTLISKDI